jgi:hypothetical protein
MQTRPEIVLWLVQERRQRDIQAANDARLAADARPPSLPGTLRRAIGHSIIRIGTRLAADSPFEPARSR